MNGPLLRRHHPILLAVAFLLFARVSIADSNDLGCQQEPGDRFFWLERGFCDLPVHGPDRANGVVIWNHGISGTRQSWMAPAPPVLRLLQHRGWDVIMLKRHHSAETENTLYRTVQRTLEEVATFKKAGYRKIVLAGQSFGGYVTLEAVDSSPTIDAAIALSPGVRAQGATGRLDPSIIERILQRVTVGRLALVLPKDDALFGYQERGTRAEAILSRRSLPYLLVDETSGISGHGGGVTGRFALQYGACLAEFLANTTLPTRRFQCQQTADPWPVVRELLLPPASDSLNLVRDSTALPESVRPLIGIRWGLLEDTIVLVAPVVAEQPGKLRLMYRSTGISGGVFDATTTGGVIRMVLPNKSTITLKPDRDGTLTWSAADGSRSLNTELRIGRED